MSLKFKFSLFTSLIIVSILISLGIILAIARSSEVQQELLFQDTLIAERVIPDLSNDLSQYYVYQFDAYTKTITAILNKYPDILHFRILSADGNIVVDSSEMRSGKYVGVQRHVTDGQIIKIILDKKTYQDFVLYKGERTIRIFIPYIDQYGVYRLMVEFNFSLRSINAAILNRVTLLTQLCIIFILIGVGVTMIVVDTITRPLRKLMQGANEFSNGNLNYTIQTAHSSDEIGQLANALNTMASKLKISYADLEQKVIERTKQFQEKLEEVEQLNKFMLGREEKMIELKQEIAKLKEESVQSH